MSLREKVGEVIEHIRGGKIVEAVERYYDDDVSMRENGGTPTVGKAANIEREKQFLSQVKDWHGFTAHSVGIDGDEGDGTALIECSLEFTNTEDKRVTMEQVAVQRWKDGKIVSERFYYDAG